MSLSGKMLAGGCALHVEAIHGESILVLTGLDQGKSFTGVRETEADMVINSELGADPRAKRMLRFRDSIPVPRLGLNDRIKTEDGKIWTAVRNPGDGFLTNDFELIEVTKKDT
jgi:hypothetical protein